MRLRSLQVLHLPAVRALSAVRMTVAVLWLAGCSKAASPETPTPSSEPAEPIASPRESEVVPSPSEGELGTPTFVLLPPAQMELALYSKLELDIETDISTSNPFDPNLLDIQVRFAAPSGREMDVGAFWYQDFDPGARRPRGEPGWKVRFTPTEVGSWTATARIEAVDLQSGPVEFRVVDSFRPGFVRIHPDDPRYFAFDSGEFFFPIGLNMGWWGGSSDALTDYGRWLAAFDANGGNTIRVWMDPLSFSIEWRDTPLGDYSRRLDEAWLLDQLFRMAESRDMYIILVLLTHCQYSEWVTCVWEDNPYNATRGGPLASPEQFATDPTARALFRQRLNYIVNRWGYSPNLLAWEWWNEVNLTAISDEALVPWLQEMTAYLRQRDVNQHLTTNSYAIRALSPVWELPELDIVQRHEYADQIQSPDRDLAQRARALYLEQAVHYPDKPILLGEFGYSAANDGDSVERTGIHLHNGLWATAFSGFAGSGMYWWWDVYVESNNLWHHFKALDRFLEGEDLTHYQPFSPLLITAKAGASARAVGLGLRGEDLLFWVRSQDYTVQSSVAARQVGASGPFDYEPPPVEDHVLILDDMANGDYTVRWFDPQTGRWLGQSTAAARSDRLTVPIPTFVRDLAGKITGTP